MTQSRFETERIGEKSATTSISAHAPHTSTMSKTRARVRRKDTQARRPVDPTLHRLNPPPSLFLSHSLRPSALRKTHVEKTENASAAHSQPRPSSKAGVKCVPLSLAVPLGTNKEKLGYRASARPTKRGPRKAPDSLPQKLVP